MTKVNRLVVTIASAVFLIAAPALAHHAFSGEFDGAKPIKLEGTVTRVDWKNPHVYFYVDVPGPDGHLANWACQTRGPSGLERAGWTRDSLKTGDKVVVQGFLARDGSNTVDGRQVTLADGRKILSGSAK